MIRKLLSSIIILLFCASTALAAVGKEDLTAYYKNIKIFVDGLEVWVDQEPLIVNGRTMIPLRPVAEALKASVEWDGINRKVVVSSESYMEKKLAGAGNYKVTIQPMTYYPSVVTIVNRGKTDLNLTSWRIENQKGNKFVFPDSFILKAGAEVNVRNGPAAFQQLPTDFIWSNDTIWNINGDKAALFDSKGKLVAEQTILALPRRIMMNDIVGDDGVIVIKNFTDDDIDLTGWQIKTTTYKKTFLFPGGFILKADQRVNIRSGPYAFEKLPTDLKWTNEKIWHGKSDSYSLVDYNGKTVTTVNYTAPVK